jgi:hypothetical protein
MHFKQEHGDEEKMTTMCSYERSDENISIRIDAYYEELAKQEEIYLEEIEEDVRMILEFEDPPPSPPQQSLDQKRAEAAEELIMGDSDDPPVSENVTDEWLNSH